MPASRTTRERWLCDEILRRRGWTINKVLYHKERKCLILLGELSVRRAGCKILTHRWVMTHKGQRWLMSYQQIIDLCEDIDALDLTPSSGGK